MAFSGSLLVSVLIALVLACVATASYDRAAYRKAPAYIAKPKDQRYHVHIQGSIYCRRAGKLFHLPGALAKVTCIASKGRGGYEATPFSVVSKPTDANGYFKINLSAYEMGPLKFSDCKVYLEEAPPGPCSVPTDESRGVSGAPLPESYRPLGDDDTRLYSIPPFVYTTRSY
ncbi:hypothetical protein V2J09_016096 [Rumex salicifolius]